MISEFTINPLFSAWPFWVLEVDPTADGRAVEKAYQKIANSLQLNIPKACEFMTPLGLRLRDEFAVREARSFLTNPEKRILAEFWYVPPATAVIESAPTAAADDWDSINWIKTLGTY